MTTARGRSMVLVALIGASSVCFVGAQPASAPPCPRCAWVPPQTERALVVRSVGELYRAVATIKPDTTVLLDDGEYRLDRMLDVTTPRVVLRSRSGDPSRVTLRGAGMRDQRVGVAISVSAADVTIADITVGYVGYHGIQVRGERGASRVVVHNVRILDTGQQLLKGSTAGGPLYADDGVVACSTLEYSDAAPGDYTDGIDVLGGRGWTVRDNTFRRIRGPAERRAAGPAILFWANSQLTIIERNIIVDSFRGIALGLGPGAAGNSTRDGERVHDHQGGWIRNNVIINLNAWADEGIEANAASDIAIDHNTVFVDGRLPWSISIRFGATNGQVRNNLTNNAITFRDGGLATLQGNVSAARPSWFVNVVAGDLRLTGPEIPAIDAGVRVDELSLDMAGQARFAGVGPDAGAYEYHGATP